MLPQLVEVGELFLPLGALPAETTGVHVEATSMMAQ